MFRIDMAIGHRLVRCSLLIKVFCCRGMIIRLGLDVVFRSIRINLGIRIGMLGIRRRLSRGRMWKLVGLMN